MIEVPRVTIKDTMTDFVPESASSDHSEIHQISMESKGFMVCPSISDIARESLS